MSTNVVKKRSNSKRTKDHAKNLCVCQSINYVLCLIFPQGSKHRPYVKFHWPYRSLNKLLSSLGCCISRFCSLEHDNVEFRRVDNTCKLREVFIDGTTSRLVNVGRRPKRITCTDRILYIKNKQTNKIQIKSYFDTHINITLKDYELLHIIK